MYNYINRPIRKKAIKKKTILLLIFLIRFVYILDTDVRGFFLVNLSLESMWDMRFK